MNESEVKNRIAESKARIKELRTSKIDPDYKTFLIAMNQQLIKTERHLIRYWQKRIAEVEVWKSGAPE